MIVEHAVPCSSFPASLSPRFSSELLAFLRGGLEEEGQRERERGGPPEARGGGVLRSLINWTVHVCTSPFTFECMLSKVSSWCDKVISMFARDARPVPPLSLHTAPPFVDTGHCKVENILDGSRSLPHFCGSFLAPKCLPPVSLICSRGPGLIHLSPLTAA